MADETNAATPPTGTDASSSKPAETVSEIKAADTIMDEGQAEENVEGKTDIVWSLLYYLSHYDHVLQS